MLVEQYRNYFNVVAFLLELEMTMQAPLRTAFLSVESYLILSVVLELVVSSPPRATLNA